MEVRVETYSGYKADESPRRFRIEDRLYEVIEIEDRWYGPDRSYFKVFASDAKRYLLRHNFTDDTWTITAI